MYKPRANKCMALYNTLLSQKREEGRGWGGGRGVGCHLCCYFSQGLAHKVLNWETALNTKQSANSYSKKQSNAKENDPIT